MRKLSCAVLDMGLLLLSQSTAASPDGTVVGTVNIDGKETKLTFIYAQRREARSSDSARFQLKDGENLSAGVIDLVAAGQPLTERAIADLIENKYEGSDIRGIWLILDPSNTHSLRPYFLLEAGALPGSMGTSMISSAGSARVEYGKLIGKLESRIQGVSSLKTYSVLFDTPLNLKPFEVDSSKPVLVAEDIPGQWNIERWWGDNGSTSTGTLTIDPGGSSGTFHFSAGKDQVFEETVAITQRGTKFHMEGRVPEGSRWNPDTLDLELHQDLLIGSGKDSAGITQDVVLRKIP